jgi:triosephosphate isomerase (EC 5.3.1.1)
VITGAGIESGEDVEAALRLGTKGVLLASAAVKAKDHYQKIMELANRLPWHSNLTTPIAQIRRRRVA